MRFPFLRVVCASLFLKKYFIAKFSQKNVFSADMCTKYVQYYVLQGLGAFLWYVMVRVSSVSQCSQKLFLVVQTHIAHDTFGIATTASLCVITSVQANLDQLEITILP